MSTLLKFKRKKTKVEMNQQKKLDSQKNQQKKLCLKNVNEKLIVKIILKSNIPKWYALFV